jgi:hypothetical protein
MRWGLSAAIASGLLVIGGCGSGSNRHATASDIDVVKAWSSALRRGDVNGAAAYFALPSVFFDGPPVAGAPLITIHNVSQARFLNQTLPCGAKFISAVHVGRYINVLFLLTGRPGPGGSSCGTGAGQTARVDFAISKGKITAWIRAPDEIVPVPVPPTPAPASPGGRPSV